VKKYRGTERLLGFAHQASSCILLTMFEGTLMPINAECLTSAAAPASTSERRGEICLRRIDRGDGG
jgi:hypothetical protein